MNVCMPCLLALFVSVHLTLARQRVAVTAVMRISSRVFVKRDIQDDDAFMCIKMCKTGTGTGLDGW